MLTAGRDRVEVRHEAGGTPFRLQDWRPRPVHIRSFRPGDEPALRAVFHSAVHGLAWRHYTARQIEAWAPGRPSAELLQDWALRIRRLQPHVAEIDERIVAYADVQASGRIDQFFVAAGFARRGVGRALMLHLHAVARARGLATLSAEVSLTAQPFFQGFGFRIVEQRLPVVRGVELSNALMRKALR